jgi:hypothetical protein
VAHPTSRCATKFLHLVKPSRSPPLSPHSIFLSRFPSPAPRTLASRQSIHAGCPRSLHPRRLPALAAGAFTPAARARCIHAGATEAPPWPRPVGGVKPPVTRSRCDARPPGSHHRAATICNFRELLLPATTPASDPQRTSLGEFHGLPSVGTARISSYGLGFNAVSV